MGEIERGRKVLVPPFLKPEREEKKSGRGERRLRVKGVDDVEKGTVRINKSVVEELGSEEAEVAESERRRTFKVVPDEKVPQNEVWANPEDLRSMGIADGTVVTVRRAK